MSNRRILILDRPEGLESLVAEGLISLSGGYEFCLEYQRKSALAELRGRGADVIIAGNNVDGGTAYEFLEEANRIYAPPIPAIVIAMKDEGDLVQEAFKTGTFDVLYRPFEVEQLGKKIHMACQMFKPRTRIETFQEEGAMGNYENLLQLSRQRQTSVVNLLAEQLAALKKTP